MNREAEPTRALRVQAEQELHGQGPAGATPTPGDPVALLQQLQREQHELLVHQIELRLQNEELSRVNAALEQTSHDYQELFDDAPVGYLTLDETGGVCRANLTVCRMLGVERPGLLRRRLSAFLAPEEVGTFALFLRRLLDRGERQSVELWLVGANGTRFAAQLQGEVVVTADRRRTAWLILTDITLQRQAQDEVRRFNATLEARVEQRTRHIQELTAELETFVSGVTHDLMTPLRHIRSFTDRLAEQFQPLEPQQARYVQHVEHSVDRMEQQLEALLNFFRAGQGRMRFQAVQLDRVLKEVLKDLAAELEGRDVQLTAEALPVVEGDSLALRLVFANLLGNALKFTRGRTPARIGVHGCETEREVVVGVRDNGVGFDGRHKQRLFGMFQRLHRQEDFEGTGVGLALVRRVIHRHGGRVWAEGKVGEGASFWFSLPRNPTERP
ncbi:sensor histidine kinase [Deinococcus sonorensis]|uniref:histidine kinase n=2 Tax=Deinococcus sonorensis TaxID=309891 RepID=A0AAU7UD59_9DEIO